MNHFGRLSVHDVTADHLDRHVHGARARREARLISRSNAQAALEQSIVKPSEIAA
jgi:hypothetical protein